jgi:MFS family permease
MKNQIKIANRNIRLYVFSKVFTKRVFLPLAAIYFTERYGFNVKEIGLLAALFALTQLIAELPTGYFADRVGRVNSMRIGAFLAVISSLIYVFSPNKTGIFIAIIIEALGYSFLAGAGEALIHDSLEVRGDVKNYSKILSRAQSLALIINAVLVALVPMTYVIDNRLPFLLGTVAFSMLLLMALLMHDVKRKKPKRAVRKFSFSIFTGQKKLMIFAMLFGVVGALYTAPSDILNLALKDFGMRPELIGWWFSAASVVGAIIGVWIHLLKNLSFRNYMIIDSLMMISPFFAAFTGSYVLLGVSMVLSIAFWRYRRIIYQDHLLTIYSTKFKATLLSAMSNVEQVNSIWLPIVIAFIVSKFGYSIGLGLTGVFAVVIAFAFVSSGTKVMKRYRR